MSNITPDPNFLRSILSDHLFELSTPTVTHVDNDEEGNVNFTMTVQAKPKKRGTGPVTAKGPGDNNALSFESAPSSDDQDIQRIVHLATTAAVTAVLAVLDDKRRGTGPVKARTPDRDDD